MENIGKMIAELRKEQGVTQEQLGQALSISAQAVSKWENGGVPDAEMLPRIADYFKVSIDALFGRKAGSHDIEDVIYDYICAVPREQRLRIAEEFCWMVQRSMFASKLDKHDNLDKYFGTESCSEIVFNEGISLMRLDKRLNYFMLMPEPECGFGKMLYKPEEQTVFFALLGQRDAYDTLFLLYTRDENPFTAKWVASEVGVTVERAAEILDKFVGYKLVNKSQLTLDNDKIDVYGSSYSYYQNPALLPLLEFANRIIHRPSSFCLQTAMCTKPFFKAAETIKSEEKRKPNGK